MIGALFLFLTGMPQARADFVTHFWERHRETRGAILLSIQPRAYSTTANFDGYGNRAAAPGLQSLWNFEGDALFEAGITHWLTIYARATWALRPLSSTGRNGTNYWFGDQTAGANFKILELFGGYTQVSLQAQADLPLYSNAVADSSILPYMGDGSFDFTGGLFVAQKIATFGGYVLAASGGAGFTYRTSGFSMAIPWSVGLEIAPYKIGVFASLDALGNGSLRTDAYASQPSMRPSAGTGGSFLANAINPTLLTAQLKLGFQFTPGFAIWLGGSQAVWGQNAASGWMAGAGFDLRLGSIEGKHPEELKTPQLNTSNTGLVSYDLQAKVTSYNDPLHLIQINLGTDRSVEIGQVFDIFILKADLSPGDVIARAKVTAVKDQESALEIQEYFREAWIEKGFIARRVLGSKAQ